MMSYSPSVVLSLCTGALNADHAAWTQHHFGGTALGDARLNRRVLTLVEAMCRWPGASLPRQHGTWAATKAAYRFFAHEAATPEALQARHRARTLQAMGTGTVLLIEDTSTFSWTNKAPINGLGAVAQAGRKQQGFFLHSVVAARWLGLAETGRRLPLELLGLADQQYYVRERLPERRRASPERDRANGRPALETELWRRSTAALGQASGRWVRVADRGADLYEYLAEALSLGHGFVVRAQHNRVVVDPSTGRRAGKLFDAAAERTSWGSYDVGLRRRAWRDAPSAAAACSCRHRSGREARPERLLRSAAR
jgi:hypothetical protein